MFIMDKISDFLKTIKLQKLGFFVGKDVTTF